MDVQFIKEEVEVAESPHGAEASLFLRRMVTGLVPLGAGFAVVYFANPGHGWGLLIGLALFAVTYIALWFLLNWILKAKLDWWH